MRASVFGCVCLIPALAVVWVGCGAPVGSAGTDVTAGAPSGTAGAAGNASASGGAGAGAAGSSAGSPSSSGGAGGLTGTGGSGTAMGGSNSTTGGGAAGSAGAAGSTTTCAAIEPVPRRLFRLSSQQYSNSVRDLLGLTSAPVLTNAGGELPNAFFADDALAVNADMAFAVYQLTNAVLDENAARIKTLPACNAGEAEANCAKRFAQTYGERAYRRPLVESEVNSLLASYTEGRKQNFDTGVRLILEAILASPFFLYRSELGSGDVTQASNLTANETATQLAYFLTNSAPDPSLIAAANSGMLATADGLRREVDRLLGLDVTKRNITRIIGAWFDVGSLLSKTKDASLLPAGADQTAYQDDLLTSTQKFIDDVLWGGGKVSDLLSSPNVFVNTRLADYYGLPVAGATADVFVKATDPERAGLLTQPGFLWARSDPGNTSIVHRGLFVRDEVVCADPLPSPPAGLLEQPDIVAALAMLPTERDKSDYRLKTNPICGGCHRQIDPYGIVLQGFDPAGRRRTTAEGQPANPTGDFSASPALSGAITGAVAFGQAAAKDGLFTACAAQRLSGYVIGRTIHKQATCEVQDVKSKFLQTDGSVASLVREIAIASFVRARAGGPK